MYHGLFIPLMLPRLTAMLGVSPYAAKAAIDAISKGVAVIAIIAILAVGFGAGAIAIASFKKLALLANKKVAIAF